MTVSTLKPAPTLTPAPKKANPAAHLTDEDVDALETRNGEPLQQREKEQHQSGKA